jgi:hypothetical protein
MSPNAVEVLNDMSPFKLFIYSVAVLKWGESTRMKRRGQFFHLLLSAVQKTTNIL